MKKISKAFSDRCPTLFKTYWAFGNDDVSLNDARVVGKLDNFMLATNPVEKNFSLGSVQLPKLTEKQIST